jgi:type II secretory pathway pseudopilin PulG
MSFGLEKLARLAVAFVEMVIAVGVVALLATIAVPGFLRARKRSRTTQILNDLRSIAG